MRVGFVRHGIGTPEVPNCSTTPLVLLAGAVRSRTRLWIFRADYIEHHFEARAMLTPISDVLCNRLFLFCHFSKTQFSSESVNLKNRRKRKGWVASSRILPWVQISLIAQFAPHGILLGSAFPNPCSVPQNGSDTANADFRFSKNEGGTEWQKPTTHRNEATS